MEKCSSCGTEVIDRYTKFKCPGCLESGIVRCDSCRKLGARYVCDKCGFDGP